MKREDIPAYFKGKNFYISLLVGVCAIVALTAVVVSVTSSNKNNLVDLNEPLTDVAKEDQNQVDSNEFSDMIDKSKTDLAEATKKNETVTQANNQKDKLLENDIVSEEEENALKEAMSTTVVATNEVVDTNSVTVMNPGGSSNLKFDEEKGLLWPVEGNVLLDYSMDKGVYFETLMQYKVNPAILIDGAVGTEVRSATKGIITEITKNEETGLTLTMSIGNNYSLVYGQLKDCKVDVGDAIQEGDIIGKIEKPTKYYILEGSNLYFKVMENEETVNPMLLLR